MNLISAVCIAAVAAASSAPCASLYMDRHVLDHEATKSDGTVVRLDEAYRDKVVLVVNTASRCGFTSQYDGLQELYEAYKDDGFVVLAYPCNDFGGQEPGSIGEIVEFCKQNYGVTFPVFDKVRVLGDEAHPLFLDLRNQGEPIGGEPKWNFTKFLLSRNGEVSARFGPRDEPMSEVITDAVEAALAEPAADAGGEG